MAVTVSPLFRPLFDAFSGPQARKAGLSQRLLREYLRGADFFSALESYRPAGRVECARVLELCRPIMNRLSPEPEGGWLSFLYEMLADGLFRDPSFAAPTRVQRQAAWFYLIVLNWFFSREKELCAPDPLLDISVLTAAEIASSRVRDEYALFCRTVDSSQFIALLRIGREIRPFDPASHTIGVYHVALHAARQAAAAGLPVDIPLVSAAALSHDVGKFGCRGADAERIPYLHYYYTWQWLSSRSMPNIAHVAANHSTWDLEFENLPIESLLLIYADFRVRGSWENGREVMHIYSLADSYAIILGKLADMTPEKHRRYETVYTKLRDFERFLASRGVQADESAPAPVPDRRDPALLSHSEALRAICNLTFSNNINLMHTITTDASFELLLEQAHSEKNLNSIRTYLHLFEEYSTYMTSANKRLVLSFLYELLMHHQGDVRRRAARIMGQILSNSGPRYRKELPASAPQSAMAPTLLAFLSESIVLWESYLDACLHPDHKITAKHALRISNSLKIIARSLFDSCDRREATHYAEPLVRRFLTAGEADRFVLIDTMLNVPPEVLSPGQISRILAHAAAMAPDAGLPIQIAILRCFEHFLPGAGTPDAAVILACLPKMPFRDSSAVTYLKNRLYQALEPASVQPAVPFISQLYLDNLKNAVHWMVKLTNIDLLCDDVVQQPQHAFHTAMHLSNLLSVSEHLPVREQAGRGLLRIADYLTVDQQNEIVVDLLRELETGQDEVSRYIPQYLGVLLPRLPDKEFAEGISFLEEFIHASNISSARAALFTLGEILSVFARESRDNPDCVERVFGLLLTGVAHYDNTIHQAALSVLCRDVLSNPAIRLKTRRGYFLHVGKKLLTLLSEPREDRLTFFTQAAIMNHLYRFLVECQVELGEFPSPEPRPVAFFPGTFDPFSSGHKRIVEEICSLGFDVYLAIDEFSWSKRTLPKLLRRQIACMSASDMQRVFVFPDNVPVNIAMPEDLAKLRALFPTQELYLVAGSDVIRNASAYHTDEPGSAADYNHIIFCRDESEHAQEGLVPISSLIRGKLTLLSLPAYYETVSSTRIREYVDKNMDISMLVDPMVQNFIYENGLYLRAPQFKNILAPQEVQFEWCRGIPRDLRPAAQEFARTHWLPDSAETYTAMRKVHLTGELRGWALGHTLRASELYDALNSLEAAEYVRLHTSGRILMLDLVRDHVGGAGAAECRRSLVNELLARCLLDDHTYALYRSSGPDDPVTPILPELGFVAVPDRPDVFYVDMRAPVAFIQDVFLRIKPPHRDDQAVHDAVMATRPRMRMALARLFAGRLILSLDAEVLNQALLTKVQSCNQVLDVPDGERRLGPYMCVPYGKIFSGEIVPNTVTKTLHADKSYSSDLRSFRITEYPGYSTLANQARTIKSFRRPVLLVDDLLHKGYRMEKLDPIFKQENVEISRIIVGIMSARGKDLMRLQNRQVECEYFIPNMDYWFTESLLYPFLGGDSVDGHRTTEGMLPSINMILPYDYPGYIAGVADRDLKKLSLTALENAAQILETLEARHQAMFSTSLTLKRLAEALFRPRLPDRGGLTYDLGLPASAYVRDDIITMHRICRKVDLE